MTENNVAIERNEPATDAPAEPANAMLPATPAPSETPAPSAAEQRSFQTWHLLNCLAADPDRRLKRGDIKRKVITKKAQDTLQITEEIAQQLLEELKQAGRVRSSEKRGTVMFELTDAGEQYMNTLTPPPALAGMAAAAPVTEEMLRYQQACLLLHLLAAENHILSKSEANARLTQAVQEEMQLSPIVANIRRIQLARQGYIEIDKQGRQEAYHLTADGRDYLAALEQHPTTEFRVCGDTINALIATARETPGREITQATSVSASPSSSTNEEMEVEQSTAAM